VDFLFASLGAALAIAIPIKGCSLQKQAEQQMPTRR